MVQKVSENFPEIPETVEFSEMRIIQPKIPEIPGPKLNGKKTSGKLGINREVTSFFEILENAVPFATESCLKFKPDFLVKWKAPLVLLISTASLVSVSKHP